MTMNSYGGQDFSASTPRPGAVIAFYVYCGLMVLLYAVLLGAGIVMFAMAADIAADDPEMTEGGVQAIAGVSTPRWARYSDFSSPSCRSCPGGSGRGSWASSLSRWA